MIDDDLPTARAKYIGKNWNCLCKIPHLIVRVELRDRFEEDSQLWGYFLTPNGEERSVPISMLKDQAEESVP